MTNETYQQIRKELTADYQHKLRALDSLFGRLTDSATAKAKPTLQMSKAGKLLGAQRKPRRHKAVLHRWARKVNHKTAAQALESMPVAFTTDEYCNMLRGFIAKVVTRSSAYYWLQKAVSSGSLTQTMGAVTGDACTWHKVLKPYRATMPPPPATAPATAPAPGATVTGREGGSDG